MIATCLYYSMLCVDSLIVDGDNYALIFIRDAKSFCKYVQLSKEICDFSVIIFGVI